MQKACCNVLISSLREENIENAPMISQLLYGETVDVLEKNGDYAKIKTDFDNTEAWILVSHLSAITEEALRIRNFSTVTKNFGVYNLPEGRSLLSIGSEIENPEDNPMKEKTGKAVAETARDFLNVPFLSGGRSFFGIDADGFVQLVYKVHDIPLPRKVDKQSEIGEVLFFTGESEPGDLAFFENENGEINHVGIMLNNYEVIHVFGKVRIDSLDSSGIFNHGLNRHTHKLRFVKRIID